MTRRVAAMLAACVIAGACGSKTPASPGPVAGPWSGTWQFTSAGAVVTDLVTATVTENGTTITGTWTAQGGATGTFTFPAGAAISGTFTISQPWFTGGTCSGQAAITGTSSANAIDFDIAAIPPAGVCQWGSAQTFSLRK